MATRSVLALTAVTGSVTNAGWLSPATSPRQPAFSDKVLSFVSGLNPWAEEPLPEQTLREKFFEFVDDNQGPLVLAVVTATATGVALTLQERNRRLEQQASASEATAGEEPTVQSSPAQSSTALSLEYHKKEQHSPVLQDSSSSDEESDFQPLVRRKIRPTAQPAQRTKFYDQYQFKLDVPTDGWEDKSVSFTLTYNASDKTYTLLNTESQEHISILADALVCNDGYDGATVRIGDYSYHLSMDFFKYGSQLGIRPIEASGFESIQVTSEEEKLAKSSTRPVGSPLRSFTELSHVKGSRREIRRGLNQNPSLARAKSESGEDK